VYVLNADQAAARNAVAANPTLLAMQKTGAAVPAANVERRVTFDVEKRIDGLHETLVQCMEPLPVLSSATAAAKRAINVDQLIGSAANQDADDQVQRTEFPTYFFRGNDVGQNLVSALLQKELRVVHRVEPDRVRVSWFIWNPDGAATVCRNLRAEFDDLHDNDVLVVMLYYSGHFAALVVQKVPAAATGEFQAWTLDSAPGYMPGLRDRIVKMVLQSFRGGHDDPALPVVEGDKQQDLSQDCGPMAAANVMRKLHNLLPLRFPEQPLAKLLECSATKRPGQQPEYKLKRTELRAWCRQHGLTDHSAVDECAFALNELPPEHRAAAVAAAPPQQQDSTHLSQQGVFEPPSSQSAEATSDVTQRILGTDVAAEDAELEMDIDHPSDAIAGVGYTQQPGFDDGEEVESSRSRRRQRDEDDE